MREGGEIRIEFIVQRGNAWRQNVILEHREGVAGTGEAREPDAVAEQNVIERAVNRLEERAAIQLAFFVAHLGGVRIKTFVHPTVVACKPGELFLKAAAHCGHINTPRVSGRGCATDTTSPRCTTGPSVARFCAFHPCSVLRRHCKGVPWRAAGRYRRAAAHLALADRTRGTFPRSSARCLSLRPVRG